MSWLAVLVVLVCQAASLALMQKIGFRQGVAAGRKERLKLPEGDNPAQVVLDMLPGVDAMAVIALRVDSTEERNDGLRCENLTIQPGFATRSRKAEPCLIELAKQLRNLATGVDTVLSDSGIVPVEADSPEAYKAALN